VAIWGLDQSSGDLMKTIAIVGAGITGVTTAYALLQRGYGVTVVDRQRYPAMETSFANGGQLSASNAEVWNKWSNVLHGMVDMWSPSSPLLVHPAPSWHKYSWFAEFIANIPNYRSNTIATTRLAITARQILFDIAARENIDFGLEKRGILHIYNDKPSFEHAVAVNKLLAEGGLNRRTVTNAEIRAIEPALTRDYYGGMFTPDDATGDIHRFTRGLAQACIARGALFTQEGEVREIRPAGTGFEILLEEGPHGGTHAARVAADGVVICAGVGSRALAAQLGDRVNVYPVKGYSITVNLPDEASRKGAPWVSLLDDKAKIVSSRLSANQLRVAGTAEFNGVNYDIRADRIQPLVDWVRREMPSIETSSAVPWAGLRPMLPDMMPKVAAGKRPGVFYNTGHGHLGWTLATATAEMTANNISAQMPV
jgi:D-amino-acid dehydrogenase